MLHSAPVDYIQTNRNIEIPTGASQQCSNIDIVDDHLLETNQTFSVLLTATDDAVIVGNNETEVTIVDDDSMKNKIS